MKEVAPDMKDVCVSKVLSTLLLPEKTKQKQKKNSHRNKKENWI